MDDGPSSGDFILLIFLTIFAMFCASSEIAFSSLDTIHVKQRVKEGDKKSVQALFVLENFDQALAALLLGNNISHIGFSSICTALVTGIWGNQSLTIVTICTTLFLFFFTEMLPKSYAKSNFSYALFVASPLVFLMKLLNPITKILAYLSNRIARLFSDGHEENLTEDEFLALIEDVNRKSDLEEEKRALINQALAFDRKRVSDIYCPLSKVEALDIHDTKEEILTQLRSSIYSRFPVYAGDKKKILGIVHNKDLMKDYIKHGRIEIPLHMRKGLFTSQSEWIDDLLHKMIEQKEHMAIVVDAKKKVQGLITMEDLLEEIVGDIWDEEDKFIFHESLEVS